MEQAELRAWEGRCIQDEAPQCKAACPLHIDVRAFTAFMGQERWDKAWGILARTMPLPGVLARICDGPCRNACLRKDAGGAIDMPGLERFCAGVAAPVPPPRPLPARKKFVGVVGNGMSALAAAWELARRGFETILYCSTPGGTLLDLPEKVLPRDVLARELKNLSTLGVTIAEERRMDEALLLAALDAHDAVFAASEKLSSVVAHYGDPDPLTLGTEHPGLFVAPSGETSPVLQAAAGRRAANSIERFTQGVSMVTGREQEGPYATRLYTNLEGIDAAVPVDVTDEASAREEGRRCLQCECMECVKHCVYLREYKSYPKVYVRQIYNNDSIVMGTRQANTMINSCMLCGLCETLCPEDFAMADVCLEARRSMVDKGKMPQSAHEFALRDMAFANGSKSALTRHAPDGSASEYVFFPGCQLTASDPEGVRAAYADLRSRIGSVGLMLRCCNAPARWSGRETLFREVTLELEEQWHGMGKPTIIAACPTCLKMLREVLSDAEIQSHWSVLRAVGLPSDTAGIQDTLAVNDPCAARHDAPMREDVRAVLERMNVSTTEPRLTGEQTECCGYGGLVSEANPPLGLAAARNRAEACDEDYVTYCVMCRDMLARAGKRALHVYDLLYPRGGDPAGRSAPGYSRRRENRARLRESLLTELWEEKGWEQEEFEKIEVAFTDEAAELMENRRILKTDVQKVLHMVREGGGRLVHSESGHFLANYRPVAVTYWVEYEEQGTGYLVHRVWSHRMRVLGGAE